MASGLLTDYLKHGIAADRPATPDLYTAAFGLWWNDDTETLDLWDGTTWLDDIASGGGGGGGIPDAPSDGVGYVRKDAGWVTEQEPGIPDAPSDGDLYGRQNGAWVEIPGVTPVSQDFEVIIQASAFTAVPATHKGRNRLILAGGNVTFNTTDIAAGQCYNIRSTGAVTLVGSGVALTPTDGGTLDMTEDMQVTVVMTSGTTGIVMGLTVAA